MRPARVITALIDAKEDPDIELIRGGLIALTVLFMTVAKR